MKPALYELAHTLEGRNALQMSGPDYKNGQAPIGL
jgi:hypothetical protein